MGIQDIQGFVMIPGRTDVPAGGTSCWRITVDTGSYGWIRMVDDSLMMIIALVIAINDG